MCLAISQLTEATPQSDLSKQSRTGSSIDQKLKETRTEGIEANHLLVPKTEVVASKGISRRLTDGTVETEDQTNDFQGQINQPSSNDYIDDDDIDSDPEGATSKNQVLEDDDVYVESRDQNTVPTIVEVERTDAYEIPKEPEFEEEWHDPSDFIEQEEEVIDDKLNDIPTRGHCILNDLIGKFNELAKEAKKNDKYFIKLNSNSYENAVFFVNDLLNIFDSFKEYQEGIPDYYDADRSSEIAEDENGTTGQIFGMEDVYFEGDEYSNNGSNSEFHQIQRAPCKAKRAKSAENLSNALDENIQSNQYQTNAATDESYCVNGYCSQNNDDEIENSETTFADENRNRRRVIRRGLIKHMPHFKGYPKRLLHFTPVRRLVHRVRRPRYSLRLAQNPIQIRFRKNRFSMHHIVI